VGVKLQPYDRLIGSLLLHFQVNSPSRLERFVRVILALLGGVAGC
jgi:hypothetical protein